VIFQKIFKAANLSIGAVAAVANAILTSSAVTAVAAALAPALAAVVGQTNFVTGFQVTGSGATAASVILVTLTGVVGGTRTYALAIPAGAAVGVTPLIVEFSEPIPASGPNVAITLNVPSFGAGNVNAAATLEGYLQGLPAILATPPPDEHFPARTRVGKLFWVCGYNHSPFVVEILDDKSAVIGVAQPFAPFVHPIDVRTEELVLHASTGAMLPAPPLGAADLAFYVAVTDKQPELIPGPW
jgi:hypothetical protein